MHDHISQWVNETLRIWNFQCHRHEVLGLRIILAIAACKFLQFHLDVSDIRMLAATRIHSLTREWNCLQSSSEQTHAEGKSECRSYRSLRTRTCPWNKCKGTHLDQPSSTGSSRWTTNSTSGVDCFPRNSSSTIRNHPDSRYHIASIQPLIHKRTTIDSINLEITKSLSIVYSSRLPNSIP